MPQSLRQPDLLYKGLDSSHYYLDHDKDTVRLAYIRVDQGGPPDHIARKCYEDVEKRRVLKPFRELIELNRFMIAIVVPREENHKKLLLNQWICNTVVTFENLKPQSARVLSYFGTFNLLESAKVRYSPHFRRPGAPKCKTVITFF